MHKKLTDLKYSSKENVDQQRNLESALHLKVPVIPAVYKRSIMRSAHFSLMGAHTGEDATYNRILVSGFWPGMKQDIKRMIKTCPTCQKAEKYTLQPYELTPWIIPDGPNVRIHVDLGGPYKCLDGKSRYLMIMMDAFSKFVQLEVLDNKEAKTVVQGFVKGWIANYSFPQQ